MSRKYNLALPIGILSITTFAIGGIVYGLLWKEAQRIQNIGNAAAIEQAKTVAENIALTVADTKSALIDSISAFRGPDFGPQLGEWQSYEPFATFTFVWSADTPDSIQLFSLNPLETEDLRNKRGEWVWNSPIIRSDNFADKEQLESPAYNYAGNREVRQQIRSQNKLSSQRALKKYEAPKLWSNDSFEWIHTDISGQDLWLGIVRWNDSAKITGVGFDPRTLREAFESSLPKNKNANVSSFTLLDSKGENAIYQNPELSSFARDDAYKINESDTIIPIGSELPGWNLLLVQNPLDTMTNALTSSGGIATGGILLVLLGSGLWLAWQSRASQLDAAQKVSFVSNVSHELKTPLTTIRMYSELLQSERIADIEKRNKYLDTIASESQRLTRMVNNVLDFSRLERGKASVQAQPQALAPRLRQYIDLRREEISQQGFTLIEEIAESEIDYMFDSDALDQIIGNLVDNSLKYANTGKYIAIELDEKPSSATITLSDRGPGLPKSLRKNRFNAFEQGDTTLVAEKKGFGLGLSIAQSLATQMGARLKYNHPKSKSDLPNFTLTIHRSSPLNLTS